MSLRLGDQERIRLARYEKADEIVALAHGGNKKIVETSDFVAGVMHTQQNMGAVLAKIKDLLDDEFQTKDDFVPENTIAIYELIENSTN